MLHAHYTGYGINLGRPPPALVCRIAKSSALAESILKKESHALHFDKIGQYLDTILKNPRAGLG
ncbi:MAG: hypothetical protein JRJ69_08055 [Deltaproteobacteria bacterium]|nr:hypothetical protein [Deltaproteobacteria bacterium]MBW1737491.1 hypothetical protein [Deltaproteobacteria bacterium]MBW1911056.1 hypothetical protein [Deltaproteobacteria bacterium]MBW2035108.1 hypothetical protein [Deltaproteobacteria bacterium]MBW2115076.1 hypothetical protein [Deltaproteobacteria bacterium]